MRFAFGLLVRSVKFFDIPFDKSFLTAEAGYRSDVCNGLNGQLQDKQSLVNLICIGKSFHGIQERALGSRYLSVHVMIMRGIDFMQQIADVGVDLQAIIVRTGFAWSNRLTKFQCFLSTETVDVYNTYDFAYRRPSPQASMYVLAFVTRVSKSEIFYR